MLDVSRGGRSSPLQIRGWGRDTGCAGLTFTFLVSGCFADSAEGSQTVYVLLAHPTLALLLKRFFLKLMGLTLPCLAHVALQNSTNAGLKWWRLNTFSTFSFSVNSVQQLLFY